MTNKIESAIKILERLGFSVDVLPNDLYTIWEENLIAYEITGDEVIEWANVMADFFAD